MRSFLLLLFSDSRCYSSLFSYLRCVRCSSSVAVVLLAVVVPAVGTFCWLCCSVLLICSWGILYIRYLYILHFRWVFDGVALICGMRCFVGW